MMTDPYKILGIQPGASDEDIKKAYRNLAKKYHPDLHPNDPAASAKMNEINAAYDILSKPHSSDTWQQQTQNNTNDRQSYGYRNEYDSGAEYVDFEQYKNWRNRRTGTSYTYTWNWNTAPVYTYRPTILGKIFRWFIIFQIISTLLKMAFIF